MNSAIRESMAPGATLEERLAWLESADIEGIELHAESMDLPFDELLDIFSRSSRRVSAVQGMSTLLESIP